MGSSVLEVVSNDKAVTSRGRDVIRTEANALEVLAKSLDDNFAAACKLILASSHHIVVTGMGKSGHIARKVAATFSATGTPAVFLHPAEAAHGDLGVLTRGCTLIVISNSGNTSELGPVLRYARQVDAAIIGIAASARSLVMEEADIRLVLPSLREACPANIAPTTSTAMQLAMGDALAMVVMDMRGLADGHLRSLHPGGAIGLRLTPVRDIMHGAGRLPLIAPGASVPDAILAMTSGGFGIAGVTDEAGNLLGVITDGDLRRHFDELTVAKAGDIMSSAPKTIPVDMVAEEALILLNEEKITAAFVMERRDTATPGKPVGVVHMHDFIRLGLS